MNKLFVAVGCTVLICAGPRLGFAACDPCPDPQIPYGLTDGSTLPGCPLWNHLINCYGPTINFVRIDDLGDGNKGIFMHKDDDNRHPGHSPVNEYRGELLDATELTASARFRVDYCNNQAIYKAGGTGDGMFLLQVKSELFIDLADKDYYKGRPDHYWFRLYTVTGADKDHVADIQEIDFNAQQKSGWHTIHVYVNSGTYMGQVFWDGLEIFNGPLPRSASELKSLEFGPALVGFNVGGAINDTTWDWVKLEQGNTLAFVPEAASIASAKTRPDFTYLALNNVVVSRVGFDGFWVQQQDRAAGIHVVTNLEHTMPGISASENQVVNLVGTVRTQGLERVFVADSIATVGSETPVPLGTKNISVGGEKVGGGNGLPDDGLLVKVWGRITGYDFIYSGPDGNPAPFIYIDDGSGATNDSPLGLVTSQVPGLKVLTDQFPSGQPQFATVTGIVRLMPGPNNTVMRVIDLSTVDFTDIPQ